MCPVHCKPQAENYGTLKCNTTQIGVYTELLFYLTNSFLIPVFILSRV